MISVSVTRFVKTPVTSSTIQKIVQAASRWEPKIEGTVDISLIEKERMRRFNKKFRGINRATDVLSFAWHEDKAYQGDSLGEVYLCPPVIVSQAKEWGVGYPEEFTRLLVHGLLHLVGYDHNSDRKARSMFTLQEKIVKALV